MRFFLTIFICLLYMTQVQAQETIPLYSKEIPNSKPAPNKEKHQVRENLTETITGISIPTLTIFVPEKTSEPRTAVIVVPGGGYRSNAIKHEGMDIAKQLNAWGVAAFVLKYRIPNDETMINKEIGPLQDAQQAMCIVRENAIKWNIDPARIGMMGFSAGGHLASTAATHFNKPVISANGISVRPDFLILGYPVISFTDSLAHVGSRTNLLGKSPSREKILAYSNELHVTPETPPTFIIHASDDKSVVPGNSIVFYESLLKNKVPAEVHFYEGGGHGFGMGNRVTNEKWMGALKNWLIASELLTE